MENLRLADEKARRGKLRSYGVKVFDRDRERNLLALHDALLTKTFKTSRYEVFTIAENRYDKHGRGLDFVGFVFYHNQTQIRKGIKKNFCRTAARLNKRNPPLPPAEYKQRICSWLGWAKYSDSKHLLKTIIKPEYYGKL